MSSKKNQTSLQTFSAVALRWLEWQCKMISDVKIGAVFMRGKESEATLESLAHWPNARYESMHTKLYSLASDVMDGVNTRAGKINCPLEGEEVVCDVVTIPIRYVDETVGVVVFLQSVRSEDQKRAVLQLFQWGVAWLESTLEASYDEKSKYNPLVTKLSLLALGDAPAEVTAHEICNLLEKEFTCARVCIGIMKGLQVNALALSSQLRFDSRASRVREMESAMEEAIDQKEMIYYPHIDEKLAVVSHKHQTLSANNENSLVLSLPFSMNEGAMGAVLLVRKSNKKFTQEEIKILRYGVELLGKAIGLKLQAESSALKLAAKNFKKKISSLFGKENLFFKLAGLALVTSLVMLSVVKTDYCVYASSTLEGEIVQVIVAPQESFIKSANFRAGDLVKKGEVVVVFDDRDLTLEHEKLLSQRGKILKEYQESLALRERAKMSILLAQISQVDAGLALVKEKLKRSSVKSPISGVIVSGDLSHSFGTPVNKGDQLFEIAPLGNYRVALNVDDHDLAKLKNAQSGTLRLVGLPFGRLPIVVSKITPVASAREGGNYFRVEASMSDVDESTLRPGMQGVAKIKVSQESILWVWTHTIIERVGLWLWSLGI